MLAWAFADKPDMALLRSLFELRSVVEPAAAAFAAERRDREDLKALKDALGRMRRHTLSTEAGLTADRDFHGAILAASRNDALVTLSAGITAAVAWTTQLKQRDRALPRDPIPEHAAVYDAIADGDTVQAAAAMRRPAMARSGARMVTSHLLATGLKTVMKASVDRVRPNEAGDHPIVEKGHGTDDTTRNAFPSGHTAGAVAIAEAVRHELPGATVPARLAAGAAGALQVTRGAHYASDVVAGAAIGWLSERLASWAMAAAGGAIERRVEARAEARAEAETEAHPS